MLEARQPDLARKLAAWPPTPGLETVRAKSGRNVLVTGGVSLHSRLDPEAEARTWLDTPEVRAALDTDRPILVFGLGLGYHVQALLATDRDIHVYEPNPAVIRAALSDRDWTEDLERLFLLTAPDDVPASLRDRAVLLAHRPSRRLAPRDYSRVESQLTTFGPKITPTREPSVQTILVVSPLSGGSLPVARHAARALTGLGHRVVTADLSSLDPIYQETIHGPRPQARREALGRRLMALIGDYLPYLAEAHRPDLLLALAQAPLDLPTLNRIRDLGVPTAFWFVEDYRLRPYFRDVAAGYDFFLHIQGRALENELNKLGVRHLMYLPLAADTDLFRPVTDPEALRRYRADLSFMGSGYPNRQRVFAGLKDHDFQIWGTEWDIGGPLGHLVQDLGRRVPTEETVLIFNAARINLNLHSSIFSSEVDPDGGFVNPRTFEIAACGAFQLVDRRDPLGIHFELGEEMAFFDHPQELPDLIDYYLVHPEIRAAMATRARARVLAEHTYSHRMRDLLNFVGRPREKR